MNTYDNNGNMTADKNRKMTISYNNRNLPATVTVNGSKIEYVYDADGTLMRRKVTNGGAVTTLHYMGDIVYSQTSSGLALSYITTSQGRIMPASGEHSYEYNVTDHLGNLRASFNELRYLQENSYNPYGTQSVSNLYSGQPKNNYLFNGKEQQTDIAGFGFYNYGARFYDPALGRWHSIDPLSEKYYSWSPYNFCAGNPLRFVDPDGMEWVDAQGSKIEDHSNIKVYIFYDPKSFGSQTEQMYKDAIAKYGEGSVALSDVTTMSEFIQDWGNMASSDIKEVNLNYHGNNQTVMLDSNEGEYITATGDGKSNRSGTDATNVQDLPNPTGNVSNAQLNLNTCQSNSKTQYELKGNRQTLMESFYNSFNFKSIRGTDKSVSYWYWFSPNRPHPQDDSKWQYLRRPSTIPIKFPGVGLPPK